MQDEDPDAPHAPAEEDQEPEPDRRPVHGLGALGCLTMALGAAVAIALLSTGNSWAGAAGIVIIAVAAGAGLWLYNVSALRKK